jgi:hypothetical protein
MAGPWGMGGTAQILETRATGVKKILKCYGLRDRDARA